MWVESRVGSGSTFHFTAQFGFQTDGEGMRLATPSLDLQGLKVLIIDDNDDLREMVVVILEHANFRVLAAGNGADALKLAKAEVGKIHILLADVEMPEMSGPDLGEALRKIRPDIRVMFMSGGAKGNLLVLNYGWAYIQKPFVPVKLVEMVTEVLDSPNDPRTDLSAREGILE